MAIIVYNRTREDHSNNENNFPIYRPSILGNPYSWIKDRNTKAMYVVKNREEALQRYSDYFDTMYGSHKAFTEIVDRIYEKYKRGEDVYLECYCHPSPCHGDIIAEKLRQRILKEKFRQLKNE